MSADKTTKMLERVRALLAKAEGTTYPAEADVFRQKADELMTQYAIEQWQIDAAAAAVGARPEPIRHDFDFGWYYEDNPRKDEVWGLMSAIADHTRVKLVYWKAGYYGRTMPAIGLESDLSYFDMLFTHLQLQMAKGLEPHPDPNKPMIENLVKMKEAGMKWERCGELLIRIGQLGHYDRNVGVKFTKLYTDYCVQHNRPRLRTSPSVYQRSFAKGFLNEVRTRLRNQREQRGTGMELALRGLDEEATAKMTDMFGPDPQRYGIAKDLKEDMHAYHTGKIAGANADIVGNPNAAVRRAAPTELNA